MTDPLPDASPAAVDALLGAARTRHAAAAARLAGLTPELGQDHAAPLADALAVLDQALTALSLIMITADEWDDDRPGDDARQAIALAFTRPGPAPRTGSVLADRILAALAVTRPVTDESGRMQCPFCLGACTQPNAAGVALLDFLGRHRHGPADR